MRLVESYRDAGHVVFCNHTYSGVVGWLAQAGWRAEDAVLEPLHSVKEGLFGVRNMKEPLVIQIAFKGAL